LNRQEVDALLRAVIEPEKQCVRRDDLEFKNPADQMGHELILFQRRYRRRGAT
jgi:hypothetical protein